MGSTASTVYARCEAAWPKDLPKLTGPEALSAVKRLYRFAMKKPWPGKLKLVTGNRYTWPSGGVFHVNPARRGAQEAGWHDIVHFVSHYCHRKLNPGTRPHDHMHATLERKMIEHVVASGWLDGKLKRPAKAKPVIRDVRYASILKRIESWERKERRARTALRKLRAAQTRYELADLRRPVATEGAGQNPAPAL